MRVTLDAIQARLRALLRGQHVQFRRITVGKVEFVTLDLVSQGQPRRYFRIGVAEVGDAVSVFSMRRFQIVSTDFALGIGERITPDD